MLHFTINTVRDNLGNISTVSFDAPVHDYEGNYTSLDTLTLRRIANRIGKCDADFRNTTNDPNYSVGEALRDFMPIAQAYRAFYVEHPESNMALSWRARNDIQEHFSSMWRTFRDRGMYLRVYGKTLHVLRGEVLLMVIRPSGRVIWCGVEKWTTFLENGDRAAVGFCPYTGEQDPDKLVWFDRPSDGRKYTNCYVSKQWLTRNGYEICPHCGHVIKRSEHMTVYNGETGVNEERCQWCRGEWCQWHNRYEVNTHVTWRGSGSYCDEAHNEMLANGEIQVCPICRYEVHANRLRRYVDDDGVEHRVCPDCYSRYMRGRVDWRNATGLLSYSTKPTALFWGKGGTKSTCPTEKAYFGCELELDQYHLRGRGSRSDANDVAADIMQNMGGRVYCKSDGSLDNGCECVTHPHTIEAIYEDFDWEEMLELAKNYRFAANRTCGFHVHVSRTAFGDTPSTQRVNAAKLGYVLNEFYEQFVTVARRDLSDARQWAKPWNTRYWDYNWDYLADNPYDHIAERIYDDMDDTRYHALNLQNSATLELRLWSASDDVEVLKGTVDFTNALVKWVCANTIEHVTHMETFESLLREVVEYAYKKETVTYMLNSTYGEF